MRVIEGLILLVSTVTAIPRLPSSERVLDGSINYDGYHVYAIKATDRDAAAVIEKRFETHHTQRSGNTLEVAVPPHETREFQDMEYNVTLISEDLGRQIREAEKAPTYNRALHKRDSELPDVSWFDTYHDYADHLQYWDDLVEAFPNNSQRVLLGNSYEGRGIFAYNLWGSEEQKGNKPVILWHATVHAREWISTMVIEYLARQLIEGYLDGNNAVTSFLDRYDFWLVPFQNPDGFVYTQTRDRLWRKNRQPRRNSKCLGTDGNRNWDFEWDAEPPSGGSTPDPCGETYRGESPGDTPENQAISALSRKLGASPGGIRSYIDFHSYGQLVLTPWGFSCDPEVLPPSLPRMVQVARGFADAIYKVRQTSYEAGPGCEILYFTTGNSRDYHHGAHGADHSWTVELSPTGSREGGFVLPPERIEGVVKEQWEAQKWLLEEVWKDS